MREEMMEVVAKEVAALRAEVKEFLFFVDDFVKKIDLLVREKVLME